MYLESALALLVQKFTDTKYIDNLVLLQVFSKYKMYYVDNWLSRVLTL